MAKKFTIGLLVGLLLAIGATILAAPASNILRNVLPETTNTYELGTTSALWLRLYTSNASTTNLTISGLGNSITNCLQVTNQGVVQTSGTACIGVGFGKTFELSGVNNDALTPTTTVGLIINYASSTVRGLSISNSTTTQATTTYLAVSTLASTSLLTISNLGNTATNCLQITNQGVVQSTGSGCATSGVGFGKTFELAGVPLDALTPTTTVGLIINYASSTVRGLSISNSTTTQATSTYSAITNLSINSQNFTNLLGTGLSNSAGVLTNSGVISNSCPGGFLSCSGTNPSSFTLGTLTVANGGTNATAFGGNSLIVSNLAGTTLSATSSNPLYITNLFATSTSATSTIPNLFSNFSTSTQATSTYLQVSNTASTSQLIVSGTSTIPSTGSSTIIANGQIALDTTKSAFHANFTATTRSYPAIRIFGFALASTTASEDFPIPATHNNAYTISQVDVKLDLQGVAYNTATTVGINFNLQHGTNKGTRATVFTNDQGSSRLNSGTSTYTNITTGFNDTTVASNEEWWFTTSAASSSLHQAVIQVRGYFDP